MKFLTGTRNRSITYVCEPKRPQFDPTTGNRWATVPLYAEFKEHKFDSASPGMMAKYAEYVRQYNVNKKSEEQITVEDAQKKVEKYLLDHPDWGRSDGRGIFLDQSATSVVPKSEIELIEHAKAKGIVPERRCLFMQDVGEDSIQCDQMIPIDAESDFCSTHEAILEAAAVE